MALPSNKVVIIGSGPAGMACAHTLTGNGQPCTVIDKENAPGGLCRTIDYRGYLFDMGGHRFLSKSEDINNLWHDIMGEDMLHVRRLSRIYYRNKYFNYPLSFFNTFWNLGPIEGFLCVASYFKAKIRPMDDSTFENWVVNRFGRRLFKIFFKTYTEKVWAVACEDISADWAVQRLRGLSLRVAIKKAILGMKAGIPKTLSSEFLYPRTGPGELYKRLQESIVTAGGRFLFGRRAMAIRHDGQKIISIDIEDRRDSKKEELPVDHLFSSMPLTDAVKMLEPQPPEYVTAATKKLRFRDFLIVNIILDKEHVFPDQWIYVHSPEVKVGRIQNYKNWSPAMVIDPRKTSLGIEYFVSEKGGLWQMNDVDLINFAVNELEKIGIVSRRHLVSGFVVRCPNAYPVYLLDYQENLKIIRDYLSRFQNFQTMGRAGLFRYDNSDHALLTGIYAAKNFLGHPRRDIWSMETGEEYLES